jgi:hypothetical protein
MPNSKSSAKNTPFHNGCENSSLPSAIPGLPLAKPFGINRAMQIDQLPITNYNYQLAITNYQLT